MGLLDNLPKMNLGLKGQSPKKFQDIAKDSTLHNEFSINGKGEILGKPQPSVLDLNGKKPATYKDNAPEGQGGKI